MADQFFDGGMFEFLSELENENEADECSSICEPQLLYLTKDISEGSPKQECLSQKLQVSKDISQ